MKNRFKIKAEYKPAGDQSHAIKELVEGRMATLYTERLERKQNGLCR
mgnify:CR=1 FL=1